MKQQHTPRGTASHVGLRQERNANGGRQAAVDRPARGVQRAEQQECDGGGELGAKVILAGFACVLGALGVLAVQAYQYLKHGRWMALSVLDTLKITGIEWASRPTDWFGLHQSLDWAPLSAALFLLGVVVAQIGSAIVKAEGNSARRVR
jgi:hypothetical protein